jgi:hypothetical protein
MPAVIKSQWHKKIILALLLLAAFSGAVLSHRARAAKRNFADFHCFYTAGQRMLRGADIYVVKDTEAAEFRYAPVIALVMAGLAITDEKTADTIWYGFNFLLVLLIFSGLKKLILPQAGKRETALVYFFCALGGFRFILHNLDAGQTNLLMLACIVFGLYESGRGREIRGAALLAFSAMLKYTPLIFVPYFLARKRPKLALATCAWAGIFLLLPAVFIGFGKNLYYLKGLLPQLFQSSILEKLTLIHGKNQSLFSAIYRLFTPCVEYFHAPHMPFERWQISPQAIISIYLFFAGLLYLTILYLPKKARKNPVFCLYDYAMLLICVALFNLNAWKPSFVMLLAGFFLLSAQLIRQGFQDRITLGGLVTCYILNIITLNSLLGRGLAARLYYYSPLTISALICFFLLLRLRNKPT